MRLFLPLRIPHHTSPPSRKISRYESATSEFVEVRALACFHPRARNIQRVQVEETLTDHEQVLRDIGKLEHHEFVSVGLCVII